MGRLADLARLVAGGQEEAAGLLGYLRLPPEVERPAATARPPGPLPAPGPHLPEQGRLTLPFWRLTAVDWHDDAPEATVAEGLRPEERRSGGSLTWRPPQGSPALEGWASLEPKLLAALADPTPGRRVHVEEATRRVARGQVLERVPRLPRRAWPAGVVLLLDRSTRFVSLWDDQEQVVLRLVGALGQGAVELWTPTGGELASLALGPGHFAPAVQPGEVVLALTDLGAADPAVQAAWARTGQELAARGAVAVALCPGGRSGPAGSAWRVVPWGPPGEGAEAAGELLRLAAAGALVQPGLLRALRLLLPAADGATEVAVAAHAHVERVDGLGLALHPERRRELLPELAAHPLAAEAWATLAAWRGAELPPELVHGEAVAWAASGPHPAPQAVQAAQGFFSRLGQELATAGPEGWAWAWYGRQAARALPEGPLHQGAPAAALSRVWVWAHGPDSGEPVPAWVLPEHLREPGAARPAAWWGLRQVGEELVLEAQPSVPDPVLEPPRPGSPVLRLLASSLVVERGDGRRAPVPLGEGKRVPLPERGTLRLHTPTASFTLTGEPPPAWAAAAGRDRYGLWAELRVKGEPHRLRWIPPGRFLMGSPQGEKGRSDHEGPQHRVTLTAGLWLGETPLTQRVWQATGAANPSRFLEPDRPVEHVSWEQAKAWIDALHEGGADGLRWRLPTEGEWEHACRAGSPGPTWRGELEGAIRAPVLEDIAWYAGNAGGGTRPVGTRHPNPWGLHDMLGNVWEWCEDEVGWPPGGYDAAGRTDPVLRGGAIRVFRGGSWYGGARYCRAACRVAYHPAYRNAGLGFRLARGLPVPEAGAAGGPARGRGGERAAGPEGRSQRPSAPATGARRRRA